MILATADGFSTNEVVRRSGLSKPNVWRWQERFMHEGVDGFLREKTRSPGKAPVPTDAVHRVLDLTVSEPPGEATHWKAHGLVPHRFRTFKLSNDAPELAGKIDVVGLCVDPPAHAIVLSVDENSQIQALDRTQPGLPMKPGRLVICRDCEKISHPARHLKGWQGILQADAYAGYNRLHDPTREPGPVTLALCWSHARRKFFELADIEGNIRKGKSAKEISPIAFEVVKRIDAVLRHRARDQ